MARKRYKRKNRSGVEVSRKGKGNFGNNETWTFLGNMGGYIFTGS